MFFVGPERDKKPSPRTQNDIRSCATQSTTPALIAFSEVPAQTLEIAEVNVTAFGKTVRLYVHVVWRNNAPLFVQDWCIPFEEVLEEKHRQGELVQRLLRLYPDVLANTASTTIGYAAVVHLQDKPQPMIFNPSLVPFVMRAQANSELNRLLKEDVLEQVGSAIMLIE
uniref:SEA domain-containing protein n=1 Tax=Trichuris muris TaxID=70415 RepID=A0A5S6QGN6_TRIMR